ncbi:MAG: ABC transporter substrate-binding protein [Chitinophagaceae bacterium]
MPFTIGLLLPRSNEYPALGIDVMHGLRSYLQLQQRQDIAIVTENIGYGELPAVNYAKAELLILQHNVDVVIAYCHSSNAELLYPLAEASGKTFLFVDPGMQLPSCDPGENCYHISLQGVHACRIAGFLAGEQQRRVLMATSFYDGGYRGPWECSRGLEASGGSVCGNYVSNFREAEFTIAPYMQLLQNSGAQSVAACFSAKMSQLFFKALKEESNRSAVSLPFYCSPFMAEEQWLAKCEFPGGDFLAIVPWATSVQYDVSKVFTNSIQQGKNKTPNLFHVLGWEAAIVALQAIDNETVSLSGFSYQGPRGTVTIDPDTHYTYAPLYKGAITADEQGKCVLNIHEIIPVTNTEHAQVMSDRPSMAASGWRNNYLCM